MLSVGFMLYMCSTQYTVLVWLVEMDAACTDTTAIPGTDPEESPPSESG